MTDLNLTLDQRREALRIFGFGILFEDGYGWTWQNHNAGSGAFDHEGEAVDGAEYYISTTYADLAERLRAIQRVIADRCAPGMRTTVIRLETRT